MNGITELAILLANMQPELSDIEMVFCTLPDIALPDLLALSPVGMFKEREGVTLIVRKSDAEQRGMQFSSVLRAITLSVHSSLEDVGFNAAVASRLALHGIGANCVAAYHHDHIFVPAADAQRALDVLRCPQAEAAAGCKPG